MTDASLPPPRPEPSPRMPALKIRRDYRRQRLASEASLMPALPPALDTPATPRTPLAAPPRPTRSRPRPIPPPIRAAPWLRSLALFGGGWQDLRTMHDSRDPCSEKCPFLAGSSRGVSSNGDLRGISDAWRAYLAKASPFSDAWRANLAANWRFSRPRPLSGCMGRKNCHGLPPGDAPRRNLATARPPRTHRARILPLPVRPRAHQGTILPSPGARKHINEKLA